MPASLHAHFLGGYRLQSASGQEIKPPTTHQARLLLAYLLLHPHRHHARVFLAGLFWPDLPENMARKRLNQALWRVRQTWDGIASCKQSITLRTDASYEVDALVFSRSWQTTQQAEGDEREERLRRALKHYAGPLLPGYYEDWVLLLREQFQQQHLAALEQSIAIDLQRGAYAQARKWAQRLVQAEPLDEDAQRQLIQIYGLLGQREQALQQYESLCQLLADEMNIAPSAATQQLIKQIQAASLVPRPPPADNAPLFTQNQLIPLVGRETAWRQIQQVLAALERGKGRVVVVKGEAGIGKSRLLAEIEAQAQWRNLQVWQAAAPESGSHSPYTLWIELLRSQLSVLQVEQWTLSLDSVWLATLAELLPELQNRLPAPPELPILAAEEARQRRQEAILCLLAVSARHAPLVLLLDDLHWADDASLEALNHLLGFSQQHPILFTLSYRDDDPAIRRRLTRLLHALPAPPLQIILPPLDAAASGQLIRAALALPHPTPHFEKRLFQATSGHPLFLLETLRALYDQGILFRNEQGRWSTPWDESTKNYTELPLTERFQEILLRRLDHLSAPAHHIFQIAALLNQPFTATLIAQIGELSSSVTLAALAELHQQRLIHPQEDKYTVSHDLLRQAVCEEMDAETRQNIHARIARALIAQDNAPAAILASHFTQAGVKEQALHYHREAALQAETLSSYSAALEHWRACLQLATALALPPPEHFDLLAGRERVLDILGQRQAQEQDIAAMLALAADPRHRSQALQRRAYYLNELSRYDEAEIAARQALALARPQGDPTLEHAALLTLSHVYNWWGKLEEALNPLETALQLATAEASLPLRARTNQELGDALVGLGRHNEALSHLQTSLELNRQLQNRRGEIDVLHLQAIIAVEQGDFERADTLFQEELALCRTLGFMYGEGRIMVNLGNLYNLRGKAYQAIQHYDAAIAIFEAIQNSRGVALATLNRVSQHIVLFGSSSADFAAVERVMAYARAVNDDITIAQGQSLMGACYQEQGDYENAITWLRQGAQALRAVGQLWMAAQDYRELARIQLALGDRAAAEQCLEKAVALLAEVGSHDPDPQLLALWGRLALQQGDLARALSYSRQAVQALKPDQEQKHIIFFWRSQILTAAGDHEAAAAMLRQAYEALQALLQDFPPELRVQSLRQRAEHCQIVAAFAEQTTVLALRLPAAAAPSGRPLRADEWREVRWTLHHPEDETISGKVERRRQRLRRLLREAATQQAAPRVEDLACALQVSAKTIKRDLAALRAAGENVRTRGSRE